MPVLVCAPDAGAVEPVSGAASQSPPAYDVADTDALVVSNIAVNDDYFHLTLRVDGVALSAKAGQFFNIACPATVRDLPYLRRPMSVYRVVASEQQVEFLYKVTGAGTRGLVTLRAGDRIAILGPLGNGFTLNPCWKNIVVLGRGVGLATLAPLAEMAAERGVGVTAILSARSRALVMSVARFAEAGARVEVVTDEQETSDPDNVERLLLRLIEAGQADAFFTCGSNRLMLLMKRVAATFQIPGEVAMEQQMACGLGMCFCCVRNFDGPGGPEQRRVCCEGPVFKLTEALSW
jgi:dihydroorotate dehydrogenase electron transfer subunit